MTLVIDIKCQSNHMWLLTVDTSTQTDGRFVMRPRSPSRGRRNTNTAFTVTVTVTLSWTILLKRLR